jgi:hypothetical protein
LELEAFDSCGKREKVETPEAKPRRLDFLPAESKCLQQKGTVCDPRNIYFQKPSKIIR